MSRSKLSDGQRGERPHISETKLFHGNSDEGGACLHSLTPLHDSLSEHCKPQQSRRSNDFVKDKYRKVDGGGRVAQMKKSEFLWDLLSQHFLQYFESSAQGKHLKVTRCWMDSPCFPFCFIPLSLILFSCCLSSVVTASPFRLMGKAVVQRESWQMTLMFRLIKVWAYGWQL